MQTFMETEQKKYLKRFHTLLGKAGVSQEGKDAILESYGVESSRDLSAKDLLDICNKLAMQADPAMAQMDKWRKWVIASIGGWRRVMGRSVALCSTDAAGSEINMIKAIACRASRRDRFNEIPLEQLRSLYYAFKHKQEDLETVCSITNEELMRNVQVGLN